MKTLLPFLFLASTAQAAPSWDTGMTPGTVEASFDGSGGAPSALRFAGKAVPLVSGHGGFWIADYNAGPDVNVLGSGQWTEASGHRIYSASGDGLTLRAEFTLRDGFVHVAGTVENQKGGDRAVIVRYVLPVDTGEAVFQGEPSGESRIGPETQILGTVYPLAAMTGPRWGASIAIPPTFPCCFGLLGSSQGLAVEFYFGLTPKPHRFPNSAPFEFDISSALPGWGFRSALAHYEGGHAEYYDAPFPGGGGYLWQENGAIDYALPLFRVQCGGRSPAFLKMASDRAARFNLLTTEDIGATVRTVRDLPDMPKDYDGAMKAYSAYRPVWDAMGEKEQDRKYPQFSYHDVMEIIDRCAVTGPDGKYRVALRDFSWSPKSIAFTTDPNPDLFKDRGLTSVGSTMVAAADRYLREDPVDGSLVDSLGANFPACLNYRQDHFTYAQYPLTFDRQGRIALHNLTSHYEVMDALRTTAHKQHKFSTANGVYRYNRGLKGEEQYHGQDNGRFFIAAILDEATRECSVVLDRKQFEFGRAAMGRKLYNVANHNWKDALNVRRQLNRALPYSAFVSSDPNSGKSYLASPDGYFRDRDSVQWFVRNARLLHAAGWQPVTFATTDVAEDVGCERYGSGLGSYFALVNFAAAPHSVTVTLDLANIGLASRASEITVVDVARNAKLETRVVGTVCQVRMELAPDEAHVLRFGLPGDSLSQVGAVVRVEPAGLRVISVDPRSGAAQSGVEVDDLIVGINGQAVASEPNKAVDSIEGESYSTIALRLRRGDQEWNVNVVRTEDERVPSDVGGARPTR